MGGVPLMSDYSPRRFLTGLVIVATLAGFFWDLGGHLLQAVWP